MKVLKKNQLAILVIALMLVTAGYLNYTANETELTSNSNVAGGEQYASIGDATLVNSGELLDDKDKQSIIDTISNQGLTENNNANSNMIESENAVGNSNIVGNEIQTNVNSENTNQVNGNIEEVATSAKTDDYFASSKLEREKMYSQMLETYQKLLESTSISGEQKAVSEQEITKINQTKNAIMISENLLSTKGFEDSVIFVNDVSVSVVVKADNLATEQIAQIQNIVSRELKVDLSNIHISNK